MSNDNTPLLNPLVDPHEIHLIVLTGMSGGGKTVALRALEDLEFYCVDNLPSALLPQLVNAATEGGSKHRRIAVGVDVRNRGADFALMPTVLSELAAAGVQVHLIFLDCRDEVLIKRYSETRRRHPLATRGLSLADAIVEERRLLRPLMAIAEKVIDSPTRVTAWTSAVRAAGRGARNSSPPDYRVLPEAWAGRPVSATASHYSGGPGATRRRARLLVS